MPDGQPTIRVLKQLKPVGGVLTDLFVVPSGGHLLVQKLVLSNSAAGAEKVTVALALKGASDDPEQHVLDEYSIASNSFASFEPQVTLDAGDTIRVKTQGDIVVTLVGAYT